LSIPANMAQRTITLLAHAARRTRLYWLRPKMSLLVLAGIGALAVFLNHQYSQSLSETYREAGGSELEAIAATWDDGFRGVDLSQPKLLQRRIEKIRRNNPNLHKISLSWHDAEGRTLLVSSGHEHDPDGTKRDVTTSRVQLSAGGAQAPIDAAHYGYREVHATDGAHYGELNYPVRRGTSRSLVAALELHYDLKALDAALADQQRVGGVAALLAALVLGVLVSWLLGRAVLRPLSQLRVATNRIRAGDRHARLNWTRSDEIGMVARDFDRMAEELQEARKDPLTGLLNHRAFQERLREELSRAEREGYPVSVVALDIDNFKDINDTWGHAFGDEALRGLAECVRGELRASDICGRVGGDEFMAAFIRSDAASTQRVVARLRGKVASLDLGTAGRCITVSAGIAEFPDHTRVQEDLLHLADGAMYWAKLDGKDRSVIYSPNFDLALSPEEAAERNLRAGLVNTVHALAKAVDAKDGYTHSHSQRVAVYATHLAQRLRLDDARIEKIRTAGVLHDVGKIGISDSILLKPGPLTPDEFEEMRRHSELGRDIIAGAGMHDVAHWVLHLHERFDGRGYPDGLRGEEIPLESRILHCADALEAMTSSRIYREAMPLDVAIRELEDCMGTYFDPVVAAALVDLIRSGELNVRDGEPSYQDSPDLAVLGAPAGADPEQVLDVA
jgi:diguanylate cyclase (GGDEF)-like protein